MKYKKNEAFVDVVETVNLIMSAKGKSRLLHYHSLCLQYEFKVPPFGQMLTGIF